MQNDETSELTLLSMFLDSLVHGCCFHSGGKMSVESNKLAL